MMKTIHLLHLVSAASGHDGLSLLFALLDEFLFLFHSEGFAVKKATVVGEVDREAWKVRVKA